MSYKIGLAARSYDPEGALQIPWREGTDDSSIDRRVNRVRTLDGGVAISNRGYSAGDRTVTLSLTGLPRALVDRVRRLMRLHGQITVSIWDGCFIGTASQYNESRQELTVLIASES